MALGVAGGAAAYALNAAAPQVAAVNLHNYVARFDDPAKLKKEDIEAIANKFVSIAVVTCCWKVLLMLEMIDFVIV